MQGVYPVADVRAAEAAAMALVPEGALMQRAATALAVQCLDVLGAGVRRARRAARRRRQQRRRRAVRRAPGWLAAAPG